MLKTKTAKIFAGVVGVTMALSTVAVPAGAQTVAELTAQINSLLAMIAQLQAQIAGSGGTTGGTAVVFNTDLTIGSTGADVTELQRWLVTKGYLQMPVGVSYGYFGPLTQSALAKYQAEAGISPAAGYFGPITRARLNAMASVPANPTNPTTPGTGITTPGAEGTLTVSTNNAGLASTVYEGDDMVAIYGINVEAKNSDIAIQRIKVNLGTNTAIYNKGYSKLYITDGSNVLASADLNSSTVVKEGSTYYITVTGFNLIVPKDGKKQIVLKADVRPSIDSTDRTTLSSISISIPANGVRGVDGAGIDQYGSSSALTGRSVTFSAELSESATLKLSLNPSSPKKAHVVATAGTNENEMDKLTVLTMDVKAEKDDVLITDLTVEIDETTAGGASTPTLYIFDGSTELDNASVVASGDNYAIFSDLDYTVPKDTTKTLTVKVDIRDASGVVAGFTAAASSTDVTAENTKGDSVTVSGTATGNEISVTNTGAEITLLSKSITTNGAPQTSGANNISTSTLTATFNVKVKALGGDLYLGTTASTTYPFFEDNTGSGAPGFKVYRNGAVDATISSYATSTAYTLPSPCTSNGTNSCLLSEGAEITFPITIQLLGRGFSSPLTSGLYSVQFARATVITGGSVQAQTFMDAESDWRTADVSFP